MTPHRMVVWAGGGKNIDIPLAHPLRSSIKVVAETPERVCFAYDAGTFHAARAGQVEVRLQTFHATLVAELL